MAKTPFQLQVKLTIKSGFGEYHMMIHNKIITPAGEICIEDLVPGVGLFQESAQQVVMQLLAITTAS